MTILNGGISHKTEYLLIRIFQAMKDYIIETQDPVLQRDLLRLSVQTTENTEAIRSMHTMLEDQQKLLLEHDDMVTWSGNCFRGD